MFNPKVNAFFVCALFAVSESGVVDNLKKCPIKDAECGKRMYQELLNGLCQSGDESLGIPKLDPYIIEDISIDALGIINVTIIEGTVEGIKNCKFNNIILDTEKKVVNADITCPTLKIVIKYKLKSSGMIKSLLGNDIVGDGNAQVDIENVKAKISLGYTLVKQGDAIYAKYNRKTTKHDVQVEKYKIQADGIKVGNEDVSEMVVNLINENSVALSPAIKFVVDTVMNIIYDILGKFLDSTPVSTLYIDDLSTFVDN